MGMGDSGLAEDYSWLTVGCTNESMAPYRLVTSATMSARTRVVSIPRTWRLLPPKSISPEISPNRWVGAKELLRSVL